MELQWNKTPCPYLHTQLRQTQMLEETMEYRLPEELPDVDRVLFVWGQCMIRNKQYRNDGIQLSGGVNIFSVTLGKHGQPCIGRYLFQFWNYILCEAMENIV